MADGFRIVINDALAGRIGDAAEEYLTRELGPRILDNAHRLVPVRDGNLKASIILQVSRDGDHITAQVGTDPEAPDRPHPEQGPTDYGSFIEQGTSKMPAQPFLRPALYQARGHA